jgi:hypothetical protein
MPRPIGALLVAVALAGALVTPACRRRAAPPAPAAPVRPLLGAVVIDSQSRPSDDGADPAAVEDEVRQLLLASGLFAPPGADASTAPTARAKLTFIAECLEEAPKGEARARVHLHVETRPSDAPGAIAFDLDAQGVEPYTVPAPAAKKGKAAEPAPPPRRPSLTALVVRITRDLIQGVAARERLREGSPAALRAALAADAGELREEAIRVIGERGIREEAPALLKLLGDDDESIRDAALGALIALRERRAVHELTQSRSLRDRREMRKIIEAISILGGQEADEYLSFVAATHDDDEIRADAAAARARMQRREAEAGAR